MQKEVFKQEKIKNLLEKVKGQRKVPKGAYLSSGKYTVVDQGDGLINGYTNNDALLYNGPLPIIVFGDHTCRLKFLKHDFCLGADGTQLMFSKKIDQAYFYYALRSLNFKISAYQRHYKLIKEKFISYPESKDNQTRIASVLSAYDNLIENNERRIKILEEMAQRLYTEWFVKFKFPGYEKVKMIDSDTEYGMIPEGWKIGTINEIVNVISGFPFKGSTYQETGRYKIVTIKNVHDGKFILNFDSFIDVLPSKLPKTCILNKGDILLSLTGNVGRVCIVHGPDHLLNQRIAKLDPIITNTREFIYLLFRQKRFQQKLEAMSNGAAQQNLSPIQVKDIRIVVPNSETLDKFSQIVDKYFGLTLSLLEENQNLSQIRDILIPQLVTGKKEIKC